MLGLHECSAMSYGTDQSRVEDGEQGCGVEVEQGCGVEGSRAVGWGGAGGQDGEDKAAQAMCRKEHLHI